MLRVCNIKIRVCENQDSRLKSILSKKFNQKVDRYNILKQSIDARHGSEKHFKGVYFVYEVSVDIPNEDNFLHLNGVSKYIEDDYVVPMPNKVPSKRPIVIGLGPAGLFCAYILAKAGLKPLIFERGKSIDERVKDVESFWNGNKLNINSNIQFGEGGAGTFSDGKLNTNLKKSLRQKFVLKTFVECGAPKEIIYVNKPHIGTDVLRNVIKNMRNKILELGGEINYSSKMTNISVLDSQTKEITINNKDLYVTNDLVLAIGHSARDTFKMLSEHLKMEPKAFAVGVRVQHKQGLIDKNQYFLDQRYLPPADYKLTYQTKDGRGVYSFCMCPGGFVVNSSSEEKRLCINGMSNHDRSEENANSAIVVTVSPNDYGNNLFDGMYFQEELENKAFTEGKGLIPVSLYKDYKTNQISTSFGSIKPLFKGSYSFGNINNIFPKYINDSIKEAIEYFDNKINGFGSDDVIIAAVEARTSSPIRILRNEELESNIDGIYPCGEGAGYAGGITSASIDGIKVAESIIQKLKN